jgi:membrane fusion protein, multidrug efflux system
MKKISTFLIGAGIAFLAVSCTQDAAKEKTTDSPVASVDTTVYFVKTLVLEQQQVPRRIDYTANLLAYEEINYAPASPGRIEEINVEVGSRVKKGDVIARMERTQLNSANEQLQNARTNYERMDTLRKLNSISEQQYDAAKTQYEVLKTNTDFLNRNTTLLSPINGIVTGKYFESGELYSGAPNTAAGKAAIVTLMQINPLKVMINVSEKYYPLIQKGMKATIGVDIFKGKQFDGEISLIYPTINTESRTVPVELVIGNSDEVLRPGMFARVSLNFGVSNVLVVPAIAVIKQEGTNDRFIFLAKDGQVARKVLVEIGDRFDDKLEIISKEIKEGDNIIIAGQEKLLDGSRIKAVQ